jgi:parallel beta helix pectate lyase-like protein
MKSMRLGLNLLAVALVMVLFSAMANAQASRTWVSGVGDDVNPCSRTAPCKTFAGAISKTAAGGEIDCLDSAGYGAVTITKAMTIDCIGELGSVLVAGTNGIVIQAGASDTVNLRNLAFQGLNGSGINAIRVLSAKNVNLEHVDIQGFGTAGIDVSAGASIQVSGRDLVVNQCGTGLTVGTSAGNAVVDVANSQLTGNNVGVLGRGGSLITLQSSAISLNAAQGVNQSAGGSQINLSNSVLSSNATAVQSIGGSTVRIIGNTFAQNGTAVNTGGGNVLSDGNNTNAGNGIVGLAGGSTLPAPAKI